MQVHPQGLGRCSLWAERGGLKLDTDGLVLRHRHAFDTPCEDGGRGVPLPGQLV